MHRSKVFVSYSHKDEQWLNRLLTQLGVLQAEGLLHVWADTEIEVGDHWRNQIDNALGDSRIAVLLISADFLTSKFVLEREVPRIIERHAEQGMAILPLVVRACPWKLVGWLANLQVRPADSLPLAARGDAEIDAQLSEFAYELARIVERQSPKLERPRQVLERPLSDIAIGASREAIGNPSIDPYESLLRASESATRAARQASMLASLSLLPWIIVVVLLALRRCTFE